MSLLYNVNSIHCIEEMQIICLNFVNFAFASFSGNRPFFFHPRAISFLFSFLSLSHLTCVFVYCRAGIDTDRWRLCYSHEFYVLRSVRQEVLSAHNGASVVSRYDIVLWVINKGLHGLFSLSFAIDKSYGCFRVSCFRGIEEG